MEYNIARAMEGICILTKRKPPTIFFFFFFSFLATYDLIKRQTQTLLPVLASS